MRKRPNAATIKGAREEQFILPGTDIGFYIGTKDEPLNLLTLEISKNSAGKSSQALEYRESFVRLWNRLVYDNLPVHQKFPRWMPSFRAGVMYFNGAVDKCREGVSLTVHYNGFAPEILDYMTINEQGLLGFADEGQKLGMPDIYRLAKSGHGDKIFEMVTARSQNMDIGRWTGEFLEYFAQAHLLIAIPQDMGLFFNINYNYQNGGSACFEPDVLVAFYGRRMTELKASLTSFMKNPEYVDVN